MKSEKCKIVAKQKDAINYNKSITINNKTCRAFNIKKENLNDVMSVIANGVNMSPTIKDKAIVFFDTSDISLLDANIYVFKSNETAQGKEVFIRRLILQPNGEVHIICDNDKLGKYTQSTRLNKIEILGRVIGVTMSV